MTSPAAYISHMSTETNARYWQAATRGLARRVNFGWWLQRWTGWLLGVALLGAVVVLYMRWGTSLDLRWTWYGIGGALVAGAVTAWLTGRHEYEGVATARIRLEDALGLKTRLTAAEAGVGAWPEPPLEMKWPVTWRWQRPVTALAASALVLLLAAWVPLTKQGDDKKRLVQEPTAVKDVQTWLEELRKEDAVQEDSAKELEEKIAELLQRPKENWYEHGSLEAAGNLKDQTGEMLRELSQNLADAERVAAAMAAAGDGLPQEAKEALGENLGAAAQALRTGGMKPGEELLQQLQQMAQGQGMGNLSKEQLEKLAKQLQKNSQALQEALKNSPELNLAACQGGPPKKGTGKGKGDQQLSGPDGESPGKGDITRGPGSAPLTLKEDGTNLDTTKTETLPSQLDMERLAPGDVLTLSEGKHEVDKNAYRGPQAGGGVSHTGDGGGAVWQNSLLPSEREALKRYFK